MIRFSSSSRLMLFAGLMVVLLIGVGMWIVTKSSAPAGHAIGNPGDARTPQPPRTAAQLLIAVEDAAGAWSRADGTGCANDIVAAAYGAVGVAVKWEVVPYARAKDMVMNGQVVACVSMSWAPELEGKVVFPDKDKPLFVFTATYVRQLGVPLTAKSEKTLPAGTRIGTVINYEYPDSVNQLAKRGIIFEPTNSEITNLKKLVMGRIDLALVNTDDLKTIESVLAKAGVSETTGVAFLGESLPGYIGFSVRHPQGAFARAKFNEGYAIIRDDGTLEKIRNEWRDKWREK